MTNRGRPSAVEQVGIISACSLTASQQLQQSRSAWRNRSSRSICVLMSPEKSEAPLASLGVASWSGRAALRCFRVGGAPRGCGCRRVRCDQLVGGEADQPRRPRLSRGEGGRGLTVALADGTLRLVPP